MGLRLNATCPNSPSASTPYRFSSESAEPTTLSVFPSTMLLDKAFEKVKKRKGNKKSDKSDENEVLSVEKPKLKNVNAMRKNRNQERVREFSELRGFGKN